MNPPSAYIICSNPRSGTTLLCDMLRQTGVAGAPDSFFRQQSIGSWASEWGLNEAATEFSEKYLEAMLIEGQNGGSVFGMRLMGADLAFSVDWLGQCHPRQHSDTAKISAAFGKTAYIHLSRQDKVAEAVSLVREEQSGFWHRAADGSVSESMPVNDPSGSDAERFASTVLRLGHLDAAWHDWFASVGVNPLPLSYEELTQDPCTALAQVLHHIGQDPRKAASVTPGTRKLSDAENTEWIARFHADRPDSV